MEENQLWEKYSKTKDAGLREKIILKYLHLVKIVAGRMFHQYNNKVEYDDLTSYGVFGLLDAIDKYDISKNIKFETYAHIRIKGAILDQLRETDWVPRSVRHQAKTIQEAFSSLEKKLGRQATDEEVSKELGITIEAFNKSLNDINGATILSLDEIITVNRETTLKQLQDINQSPYDAIEQKNIREILISSIKELPEKEKTILTLYYYEELTYKEISKIIGISESRISQLHTKAIIRLKVKLAKHNLSA